ncbi:hypothetical protein BIW11_08081 [Tropilaelaps mercedesae]|uniref:Secreted protein n=1 Tax=Tropilaelaps mercedesae TaxID=418985 RepID=A0A1V9XR42_9ACAR|nr:hypothetical protein BIW11_08081 [Tropilaelaps mercedesae]
MNVPASVAVILIIYQTGPGLCQVTPPRWPQQGYDPGLPNAHPYSARLGRNSKGEYALAWFPRVRHSKEPGYTGRPVISTANNTENRSGGVTPLELEIVVPSQEACHQQNQKQEATEILEINVARHVVSK